MRKATSQAKSREDTMAKTSKTLKPGERKVSPTPIYDQLVEQLGDPWPHTTGRHTDDEISYTDKRE